MVKVQYVSDLVGGSKYCSCNSCGKSWKNDPKMIQVRFQNTNGFGVVVALCDKCRQELYKKI